MRVLFIDPAGWQKGLNVGLAYLSACLIKNGFEVKVADLNNTKYDFAYLKEMIAQFKPDIAGFSIKSSCAKIAGDLGRLIKESFPDIYLVAGGPHISIAGEEFLKENPFFDLLVVGEAEKNICEIFRLLIKEGSLEKSSLPKSNNQKIIYSDFIMELDRLPIPNYDVFEGIDIKQFSWPLLTSRGCPYFCYFCCVGRLSGKTVRIRTPENVIEELKIVKKLGINTFEIIDDNFTFDMARAKRICDLLIEEKLEFEWSCPNGIRADRMDRELAIKMKASGCQLKLSSLEAPFALGVG